MCKAGGRDLVLTRNYVPTCLFTMEVLDYARLLRPSGGAWVIGMQILGVVVAYTISRFLYDLVKHRLIFHRLKASGIVGEIRSRRSFGQKLTMPAAHHATLDDFWSSVDGSQDKQGISFRYTPQLLGRNHLEELGDAVPPMQGMSQHPICRSLANGTSYRLHPGSRRSNTSIYNS